MMSLLALCNNIVFSATTKFYAVTELCVLNNEFLISSHVCIAKI